jgi:hypothetical protein
MNKIKLAFIATAILAGVGGAFATKPCVGCEVATQYGYTGSSYFQVGQFGVDYDCLPSAGNCTYYRPDPIGHPGVYAPCRTGSYTPLTK